MPFNDEYYMRLAYQEAQNALSLGEVPVGAIVVANHAVIGKGHNLTQSLKDVTAHSEMQAITAAANFLGAKYLKGCTIYVTLEPCSMCAGALFWSQIDRVVYGAKDNKRGACKQTPSLFHPATTLVGGILEAECTQLITDFFRDKR